MVRVIPQKQNVMREHDMHVKCKQQNVRYRKQVTIVSTHNSVLLNGNMRQLFYLLDELILQ